MDADPLSLLIILRQELKDIACHLRPQFPSENTDDIMTNNGLPIGEELDEDASPIPPSDTEKDEDEKAAELQSHTSRSNSPQPIKPPNHSEIAFKIEDLIQNYLTPSIKQFNKKNKRKKPKNSKMNHCYERNQENHYPLTQHNSNPNALTFPSSAPPSPFIHRHAQSSQPLFANSSSHHHSNSMPNGVLPFPSSMEPGQIIDGLTENSIKISSCCRKCITSLFCGCGLFQTIGVLVVLFTLAMVFIFYKASDLTALMREMNNWKQLSVREFELKLANDQAQAQFTFDLEVDTDKLKQQHDHVEKMALITARQKLTEEFIDRNTRTVTTTYWNFLTTETETVSQTIFSEDDVAYFQNNILGSGFSGDGAPAIQSSEQQQKQKLSDANDTDRKDTRKSCQADSCQNDDSFDAI